MKSANLSFKFSFNNQMLAVLFVLALPLTSFAAPKCCGNHGGIASCNAVGTAKGVQICADGTASACVCKNKPVKKERKKAVKTTTKTAVPAETNATTTAPASSNGTMNKLKNFFGGKKTAPATTTTKSTGKGYKGCCSGSGGLLKDKKTGAVQYDRSSGHIMCADGKPSTSCMLNQ